MRQLVEFGLNDGGTILLEVLRDGSDYSIFFRFLSVNCESRYGIEP